MRGISWIKAVVLTVALIVPAAACAAADAPVDDLPQLQNILTAAGSTPVQRDDAARRLVERASPDALEILRDSFQPDNLPAQLAIARALAQEDANPDPSFIPLLKGALGGNVRLTETAAQALVNYRNDPDIFTLLKDKLDIGTLPDLSREAILTAMGNLLEQQAAEYLIMVLNDQPDYSVQVHAAAAKALGEMTGLHDNGQDLQRWQQWWNTNKSKTPNQWRADLLASRAREEIRLQKRYDQLLSDMQETRRQYYSLIQDNQKEPALLNLLSADPNTPERRIAGATLVYEDFEDHHPPPESVLQRLRALIADNDRDVRDAVILTLGNINDQDAAPDLIQQLGRESDLQIRLKIASALGRMNNLEAVPQLLKMLDDPYFSAASAAADALANLGENLKKQIPSEAAVATDALQKILDNRSTDPASGDLRVNCVRALAALAPPNDARSDAIFQRMMRPGESDAVHEAALTGMDNVNNSNDVPYIVDALKDVNPQVQLKAAQALEGLANFSQADQLNEMLVPQTDPQVRDAVWQVLQKIFKTGSADQLTPWPDRFKDDPDKQLVVRRDLRDAMLAAGKNQDAAYEDQNIGETLLKLTPKQPDEAADSLQKALNYWSKEGKNQPGGDETLDALVGDMLDALLDAKRYQDAADFSAAQLKSNSAYEPTVGAKLKIEAQRLKDAGDGADAKQLIEPALKIPWAPDSPYQSDLKQTLDEINAQTPAPTPAPAQ